MLIAGVYIFTVAALLLFAVSWVLEFFGRAPVCSFRIMIAAMSCCACLFLCNWWLAEAPPFGNMRHVLSFLPLASVALPLQLKRGGRWVRLCGRTDAMCIIALIGALCMPLQATWKQAPALQSLWFAPHVCAYVISYAWLTVAALMVAASYFRPERAESECAVAEHLVLLAFPLMSFGLGSGMLWADDAWGTYWSWDIKEAWSLLTWSLFVIWFHLRRSTTLLQRRPLLLLGFGAVVITFLVVNLLPHIVSLHSYAS